ncbi:MAG: EAL domain-containing protein [Alphaproteobacteria bacterium]|nr:EAL domain-containing protein [Alphaproteobacteria bacterium]
MAEATVLLTSAGSLVAFAILRCLEGMRGDLTIVGANSVAAPAAFACDRLYRVPPTAFAPAHEAALRAILAREKPRLVLPGRDEDLAVLAVLAASGDFPETLFPVPPPSLAPVFLDKRRTDRFARDHGLPFAPTAADPAEAARAAFRDDVRLAAGNHEFSLCYQPKVSLAHGGVVGFEALLRWQSAQLGMIPPGRFIPILEEEGLMGEVGEWVLRAGLQQLSRWHQDGAPRVRLAINLSARQLRSKSFAPLFGRVLRESGVDPAMLEIEITESMVLADESVAARVLGELHGLGVRILMDDFGTGLGVLNYLRKLPIHGVKIDREFVSRMEVSSEDERMVASIVAMTRALGCIAVAEGVETAGQARRLAELGCSEAQGYFFAPPLPACAARDRLIAA